MTKLSKAEQKDKMEFLLEEFSLTHVRKNLGRVLSGGERRRNRDCASPLGRHKVCAARLNPLLG